MIFSYFHRMSTDPFLPGHMWKFLQLSTLLENTPLLLVTPDIVQRSSSGIKLKETHTELYSW